MVLATPVSRVSFMLSHIACSLFGTLVLLVVFALGSGLAAEATAGETADLVRAALNQGAAIFPMAGLVALVYGLLPRQSRGLAWAVVMVSLVVGPSFGPMLNIPDWAMNISPFTHVEMVPGDVSASAIAILIASGVALFGMGLATFSARNLSL